MTAPMTVLVTGAAGFVGRQLVASLAASGHRVLATDVRSPPAPEGVDARVLDIRDPGLSELLKAEEVDVVVHLAAVVTPPPGMSRETQEEIDVGGTRNVIDACVAAGVRRLVYTSSGAAYGYHADNAPLLTEDDALRGNEVFAYAWHKRLVEDALAAARERHPELEQVVFRVSTVLGPSVDNQITALFEGRVVVGIRGVDTPFCFVAVDDVVACLERGVTGDATGVFNLTGDGVLTLREIASGLGRRHLGIPPRVLRKGLASLSKRGLTAYGPEQMLFLQHRPVLSNERLKRDFGFVPQTSRSVFESYRRTRAR